MMENYKKPDAGAFNITHTHTHYILIDTITLIT